MIRFGCEYVLNSNDKACFGFQTKSTPSLLLLIRPRLLRRRPVTAYQLIDDACEILQLREAVRIRAVYELAGNDLGIDRGDEVLIALVERQACVAEGVGDEIHLALPPLGDHVMVGRVCRYQRAEVRRLPQLRDICGEGLDRHILAHIAGIDRECGAAGAQQIAVALDFVAEDACVLAHRRVVVVEVRPDVPLQATEASLPPLVQLVQLLG